MSVSGISMGNLFDTINQSTQTKMQQIQQEFQQLGQDLQSGNLSAAQSDFATLQQLGPQSSSSSSPQNSTPLVQAFQQLGQDLQSGNVSAAQQDYTKIQQDVQQAGQTHGHHHHHGGGGNSAMSQLFQQLGQALQSGDISTAQQLFTTLQQDLQQAGGASSTQTSPQVSSVSVTA